MLNTKRLGQNVLLSRREMGLTQDDLAMRIGVSRAYITNIEAGRAKNVGVDVIFGLSRELGVAVPYLLGLTDDALGEGTERVLQEMAGNQVTIDVENAEQRNLIREAIDALFALPVREQRRALQFLRMMRQIEEEEQGVESPRVVE